MACVPAFALAWPQTVPANLADALDQWASQVAYQLDDGRIFPMQALRSLEGSSGLCGDIADIVSKHLQALGFDARTSDAEHPDDLGMSDRACDNMYLHEVTIVRIDEAQYFIDFTAAQFGYSQFPLMHMQQPGGSLHRL